MLRYDINNTQNDEAQKNLYPSYLEFWLLNELWKFVHPKKLGDAKSWNLS